MHAHFYHTLRANYREPRLKQSQLASNDEAFAGLARLGLGRIVALYCCSTALYQLR
jgi:hypothetical protein